MVKDLKTPPPFKAIAEGLKLRLDQRGPLAITKIVDGEKTIMKYPAQVKLVRGMERKINIFKKSREIGELNARILLEVALRGSI